MKHIKFLGKFFKKFTIVDDKDYPLLSKYNWYLNSSGYATNGKVYLHQLLLPKEEGKEVDHKDGNKLNNQRINLRYVSRSQHHANRKKKLNTTSKYKGVSFKDDTFRNKPWRAKIGKDYKRYYLGNYNTEKEAALAYNQKAKKIFGEFARYNVV